MADGRGTGGGIYAILVIVVTLLVVIILFMTGTLGGTRQADTGPALDVRIEAPQVPQPQN
ncbi:MAG: hypothetical protein H0X65_03685 [Gemmatimonadetes bacterium]|nr:hypothetical protein [Gemmatimonadota bacterium]